MDWRSTMRSTISVAVMAAMLAGCAGKSGEIASAPSKHFGGRADSDLGVATRALAALNANDFATAVTLSERAVEKAPQDAGFRTLLGNAYFAAGRFHSAEQSYEDALMLYGAQPQTLLKLALAQIAQGKNSDALRTLDSGRNSLDASDYGLALALAGRPADAVRVLDEAARSDGADARVRQNLALAYALSGDWNQARVVAAQDVAASDLDAHLKQWMALANPAKPSDQVAMLLGVTPAASDAGQPVRLALRQGGDIREASATPAPTPAPVAQPAPLAVAEVTPAPQLVITAPMPMPTYASAAVDVPAAPVAEPTALSEDAIAALPAIEVAAAPAPAFDETVPAAPTAEEAVKVAATSPAEAPMAMMAVARTMMPKARKVAVKKAGAPMSYASAPMAAKGKSNAVVQLGAYSNPDAVQVAWDRAVAKYAALRDFAPMSARFDSGKAIFYRLSVQGFASQRDAAGLCSSLKRAGRACFVRTTAGDKPIQIASR